jgi:uncharacterized membrane-anchored protein
MTRRALVMAGLALAIAIPGYAIVQKERLIANGAVVLLELAPVDPRSLIQGDYMRLRYDLTLFGEANDRWPRDGNIVVTVDTNRVATFARLDDGSPLGANELRLQYRKRDSRVRVATDAYYFEEGSARRFEGARYGELRVAPDGGSVLVGLRDSLAVPIR